MTLCNLVGRKQQFEESAASIFIVEKLYFHPEDGGNNFMQNSGLYLQNNIESDVTSDYSPKTNLQSL